MVAAVVVLAFVAVLLLALVVTLANAGVVDFTRSRMMSSTRWGEIEYDLPTVELQFGRYILYVVYGRVECR